MQNDHARTPFEESVSLVEKMPRLVDRRTAHSIVEQVYDAAGTDLDGSTQPFVRESFAPSSPAVDDEHEWRMLVE